ncbi:MAG: cellobiose phosphorylase, partial [Geminicoccales bacterium]
MTRTAARLIRTARDADLGLRRIANQTGLSIGALPNGGVFAIEHRHEGGLTMVNQVLGSALQGSIARLYLRAHAPARLLAQAVGPGAKVGFGAADDRFAWQGETGGLRHRAVLWLHPRHHVWLWRLEVANAREVEVTCDAILVQDVGLAARGSLMINEAYASQYVDHHVAEHPDLGPVVM